MIHGGNVWQGSSPAQWLDYSANIRPEGAPEWVRHALLGAMDRLSYYPDPSMVRARRALADYLNLPFDFVLPSAGGISAIRLAAHLDADCALTFAPCFAEYAMLCENQRLPVQSVPLLTGRHEIGDPASLIENRLPERCIVWLCNPLNPVGVAFTAEQVLRLLAVVEKKNGWLVVDEAFIEYCPQHTVSQLIASHERLLITGSMTKILGVPGVRLGYLCAQPHILNALIPHQLTWELSCFAEAILCALPEHKSDIHADCALNAERREQLSSGLASLGIFVYPSESAFILADFSAPVGPIADFLKSRGILVRRCMNFEGIDDGCHLRLAVKDPVSNKRLIDALKEAMQCSENL